MTNQKDNSLELPEFEGLIPMMQGAWQRTKRKKKQSEIDDLKVEADLLKAKVELERVKKEIEEKKKQEVTT